MKRKKFCSHATGLILALAFLAACSAPTPPLVSSPTRRGAGGEVAATPSVAPSPSSLPASVTKDIAYTIPLQSDIPEDRLDIYAPAAQKDLPLVVFAHGSGQQKEDYARLYRMISEQGAVVFGMEWPDRPSPVTAYDVAKRSRHVTDIFGCAIRFARSKFGGDQARVILMGFSAGAGAGAPFVLSDGDLDRKWNGLERAAPPPLVKCVASGGSTHVDAFVGVGGPYGRGESIQKDDPKLWQIVNPYAHIGENKGLRVRLLHGQFDTVVPIESSIQFNDALSQAGYDSKFIKFDSGHIVPFELAVEEVVKLFK